MALRRRDQIPPYEIMRSRANTGAPGVGAGEPVDAEQPGPSVKPDASTSGSPPAAAASSRSKPAASAPEPSGAAAPWWVGSSAPIVLRVPRGLALIIVVGVLLLLVLSYWVGTVRGRSAANQLAQERAPSSAEPVARRTPPIAITDAGDRGANEVENQAGPAVQVFAERRETGLNYLCLLTGDRDECVRLAEFLADKQVAIQLVNRDNGSCVVYAVDYGFRGSELSSDECLAYKRKLQDLGRAWKRFNNNRGSDLGTMYYALFTGKAE